MLIIFQILFVIFSLLAIAAVVRRRREGALGPKGLIFWTLFWIAVVVVVIWPETASMLAARFGIGRGSDFVLYVSIAIIFFLLFRLNVKIEGMNRDITKIVRTESLRNVTTIQK